MNYDREASKMVRERERDDGERESNETIQGINSEKNQSHVCIWKRREKGERDK